MRNLSQTFMDNLKEANGMLYPLYQRITKDHTLMLSIRNGYINIYYRGGNVLRITEKEDGNFTTYFDDNYNKLELPNLNLPEIIENQEDAFICVNSLQTIKGIMDIYFAEINKSEREFQQLIVRENNFSNISNESEYFISDIEIADSNIGARFDLMGIRWLASQRKSSYNGRPALFEMKYGDNALGGKSGLLKHMQDIEKLRSDDNQYKILIETLESQLNQLDELGLLAFNRTSNWSEFKLSNTEKPEVIFVLANHNPRKSGLSKILNDPAFDSYGNHSSFDLRFYVSSFSGYALHSDCMVNLTQFRDLLNNLPG